jgi:surface protein
MGNTLLRINIPAGSPNTFTLPIAGFTGQPTVTWGDGTLPMAVNSDFPTHTYPGNGPYAIEINGGYKYFGTTDGNSEGVDFVQQSYITEVTNWGSAEVTLTSLNYAFFNAINLTVVPATVPVGVKTMQGMFGGSQSSIFNQDIGGWDVSRVTDMGYMFNNAAAFNQDISRWDVSKVTDMSGMFLEALAFNQNISTWDVSNVTNMDHMFGSSFPVAFNQDLGNWNVSNVTNMDNMFGASTLSVYNYDQTLIGWAGRNTLMPNVHLGAFNIPYTSFAVNAHNKLTTMYNWLINDAGLVTASQFPSSPTIDSLTSSTGNVSVTLTPNIPQGNTVSYYMYSFNGSPFVPITPVTIFSGVYIPPSPVPDTYNNFINLSNGTYNFGFITVGTLGQYSDPSFQNLVIGGSVVPCFDENTNILCLVQGLEKNVLIKNLKPGDVVKTYSVPTEVIGQVDDNGYKKIEMIGKISFVNDPTTWERCMYKYKSDHPLLLTGWHSILVESGSLTPDEIKKEHQCRNNQIAMIDDKHLVTACNSEKFEKITRVYNVVCYHMVLESTDHNKIFGIWGNGVLAETISKYAFINKQFTLI